MCSATVAQHHQFSIAPDVGSCSFIARSRAWLGLRGPPVPEWGAMIAEGRDFIFEAWWISTLPGLAIVLTGTALCLIGDGLAQRLGERRHALL
jgi:peptide/nickel transport system permease protein